MSVNHKGQFIALRVICVLAGMLSFSFAAYGGENSKHTELDSIKQYAPILCLAKDEGVYPTLPHTFAFDGIDNDGDGYIDLEDPNEINIEDKKKLLKLIERFEGLPEYDSLPPQEPQKPPRRAIYSGPKEFKNVPTTDVYQYWFYYLYDQGLNAHNDDSEHAFVFVDKDDGKVRGIVGAGHTGATANNVLVVGRELKVGRKLPKELPKHIPILVELGKHASAPDRTFDGRFDLGMDANLFAEDTWGSRDVMTVSGETKIGKFRQWYSFPRDGSTLIFEESWQSSHYFGDYMRDYEEQIDSKFDKAYGWTYELFPLEDMCELYNLLEIVDFDSSLTETEKFLEEHKSCFWGKDEKFQLKKVKIVPTAFKKMREWPKRINKHRALWKHNDHKHPNDIFKLWLFPLRAIGVTAKTESGGVHWTIGSPNAPSQHDN